MDVVSAVTEGCCAVETVETIQKWKALQGCAGPLAGYRYERKTRLRDMPCLVSGQPASWLWSLDWSWSDPRA